MKIYEAYDNIKIRRGYKLVLMAQGLSLLKADKIYDRFGSYISRIRSVGYDRRLLACTAEADLIVELDEIFKRKWKDHLGYPEIPEHFYAYIDYLHGVQAKDPTWGIEGLEADSEEAPAAPTRYESKVIAEGKLRIITNPTLIRTVRTAIREGGMDAAIEHCRRFYQALELNMTDEEWAALLEPFAPVTKGKTKTDKALVRSIELTMPGGAPVVLGGTDALETVASLVGIDRLKNCAVRHMGQKLLARTVPPKMVNYYRPFTEIFFLNSLGGTVDKFKTISILNSTFRLRLSVRLTNDKPMLKKRADRILTAHLTESEEPEADVDEEVRIEGADTSMCSGDGTLNLF